MYIDKTMLLSVDAFKNVVVMFLLGWILTGEASAGLWIGLMEWVLHVIALGDPDPKKKK